MEFALSKGIIGDVLEKGTASSGHSITHMRLNLYLKKLHKTLACHIYAGT